MKGSVSKAGAARLVVGVISDTHDLLRPSVLQRLRGADHIIHAGDICQQQVLDSLRELAPVSAVRGNNDRGAWATELPDYLEIDLAGRRIALIHDLADLQQRHQLAERVTVVISGHSHQPSRHREHGVLYLNPGSAGPRRFRLPISMARLYLTPESIRTRLFSLGC